MKDSPIFGSPKTKSSSENSTPMKENIPKSVKNTPKSVVSTPKNSPKPTPKTQKAPKPAPKPASPVKKPLIRESKLVLNEKLLERLRQPSHQVEFYQAIQRSMQSADKTPPKLVQGPAASMINPGNFYADYLPSRSTTKLKHKLCYFWSETCFRFSFHFCKNIRIALCNFWRRSGLFFFR